MAISGNKAQKHVFKPDATSSPTSGNTDDEEDPVTTLEWDPLSLDYLLLCNRVAGVRLVDVPGQRVIMFFTLPSAASRVQTMGWVHNAPGMFVTGGDFYLSIFFYLSVYLVVHSLFFFFFFFLLIRQQKLSYPCNVCIQCL